jgi:hypothetical protein
MTYQETATQIIKESIKSAIFIDENARDIFSDYKEDAPYEEGLSVELYNSFKEQGISLAIQKFENGQHENTELIDYLFKGRDLVLLDWKLDGKYGEDYSLIFLKEIIKRKNIHFCVIYTSEPQIENIYTNILTYFSGFNKADFDLLKESFEAYEDYLKPLFGKFNLFDFSANKMVINEIIGIGNEFSKELRKIDNNICIAFRYLQLAFGHYHKSEERISFTIDSFKNKTIVINK